MKKTVITAILTSFLLGATILPGLAAEVENHQQGNEAAMYSDEMHEMMMKKMGTMQGKGIMGDQPCMCSASHPDRHHRKSAKMSDKRSMDHGIMALHPGMMHQQMDQKLFLERIKTLDLNPDQVTKLKEIHSECRKENIRTAAEAKIARLELNELLNEQSWTLETAEALIRKIQSLEGDMQVRHLQTKAEVRKVLTADQWQQLSAMAEVEDHEGLFN